VKPLAVAAVLALAVAGAVVWHRRRHKRRAMPGAAGPTRPLARKHGPAGVPAPQMKRAAAPEVRKTDTGARRAAVLTMA
jgi:hypothetical protein